MNLSNQRRMAAQILKVGVHRVWMHDDFQSEIADAVQKKDVRELIQSRVIRARPIKGTSRGRVRHSLKQKAKGARKGHGSRRGTANARTPKKRIWISRIRALRSELATHREAGYLEPAVYRLHYRRAKGGMYRSRAHLRSVLQADGIDLGGK